MYVKRIIIDELLYDYQNIDKVGFCDNAKCHLCGFYSLGVILK
jgi:hypothetical protein